MASSFGLTGPQLTILKLLESFPDLSLSTLSERIHAQNSTVTGIIDRMEREGLVRRERSRVDRRVVLLRLSEKGARLAQEIQVEPMEIFRQALFRLDADDLHDLLRILMKLQREVLQGVAQSGSKLPALPAQAMQALASVPEVAATPQGSAMAGDGAESTKVTKRRVRPASTSRKEP
ncbi:MarR family transcriptional regulator [Chondromyces crocatus]|nr:MarR family transcriptional regulator [Chondromyces crocatus]